MFRVVRDRYSILIDGFSRVQSSRTPNKFETRRTLSAARSVFLSGRAIGAVQEWFADGSVRSSPKLERDPIVESGKSVPETNASHSHSGRARGAVVK